MIPIKDAWVTASPVRLPTINLVLASAALTVFAIAVIPTRAFCGTRAQFVRKASVW
jgi:hypothetical protein